jgi:protein-tyrosine phosphatase
MRARAGLLPESPDEQALPDRPMRIDWITTEQLGDGLPGRLGLTHLPGKHGRSDRYPGVVYRRDLGADLRFLREQGIRSLLLLVEDEELRRWGDPHLVARAAGVGIRVHRHPLADGAAPASTEAMDAILRNLAEARSAGDVVVACMGGVGRTGMVAACALVQAGQTAVDAIDEVRRARHPGAVETEAQCRFVQTYARQMASRGALTIGDPARPGRASATGSPQ